MIHCCLARQTCAGAQKCTSKTWSICFVKLLAAGQLLHIYTATKEKAWHEVHDDCRKEKQEEDDRREAERLRKVALEQAAHEAQLQELAPKLEAMETSWNRLRTITGADAPEEVIAFWEGLKSKEEHMQQLVAAAEAQEASIKVQLTTLVST